jgi:diguanylate cyclase (GGDEF)-like protein
MVDARGARPDRPGDGIDSILRPLFDWFTGLPAEEAAAFREDILDTVMLRPSGLLLSGLGFLLMSGTAMMVVHARWATAWFLFDLVVIGLRLIPTLKHAWRGTSMPGPAARLVVCIAFLVCFAFGLGCAASILIEKRPLAVVATASMMGLVAGLSTRWAPLPRMALPAIAVISAPFCVAVMVAGGGSLRAGAVQFAVVAAATAALTLQNNRTLVALFRAERRNRLLAITDSLTTLPNRAGLLTELERLRRNAAQGGTTEIASLFIDLDGFKAINDRHGHGVGDGVLAVIATRLRIAAAPHFVCRLGGDEFVVVMETIDRNLVTFVARHISERLGEPIRDVAEVPVHASASVGIAFGSIINRNAERILADADKALYLAKEAGGGRHAIDESQPAAGEPLRASA